MTRSLLFAAAIVLAACSSPNAEVDLVKARQELLSADSAFSAMSADKGMAVAFLYYADSNVVELNEGEPATLGLSALANRFRLADNSKFLITWKTLKCEVAESGDFGYTFGDWRIDQALPSGGDTVLYGNYVSIWKKQADGNWKYVLDGGTSTPGPTVLSEEF